MTYEQLSRLIDEAVQHLSYANRPDVLTSEHVDDIRFNRLSQVADRLDQVREEVAHDLGILRGRLMERQVSLFGE